MQAERLEVQTATGPRRRIEALDLARCVALLAMAIYHFTWDLEFFGYLPPGMTAIGGWKMFARCIATSFLVLVGVSLFLAHGDGVRWRGFWRRFAMVAAAALIISLVTYFAVPSGFIFFGILHQIALASLLGLAFLRLPAIVTLLFAAVIVALPFYVQAPVFDHPALWWVGLSEMRLRSNDYVPLFPWFAAVLVGIAAARMGAATGLPERLSSVRFGSWARWPLRAGRHSLAVYLIHQPVLIGCVWLFSQIMPATPRSPDASFSASCQATCGQTRDEPFCARYCGCMLEEMKKADQLQKLLAGDQSEGFRRSIGETAGLCTDRTEDQMIGTQAP